MSDKLLAEWFWTDRWMGSSAFLLPLAARGLYREMLTQAWRRGARLPNNHDAIKRAVGVTDEEWATNWPLIASYFRVRRGFLVNHTQVEIYTRSRAIQDTRSVAGRRGGLETQALKRQANRQAKRQANVKPPSPSPSPSPAQALRKNPPTPLSAKGGPRRYLRADLKEAQRVRQVRFGGCPHDPRCDDHVQCEVLLAIAIAERRKAVAK